MNSLAIADAIALRFNGLSAGGETASATARLPNTIGGGPIIIVYPPEGELEVGATARRNDLYTFPVRMLRDPVDFPTRTVALYAWFDAMHDLLYQQIQLGLAYVSEAEPVACSLHVAEDGGTKYQGTTFDTVELLVEVRVNEHLTGVAV